jgi:DNA polymerase III alpha subunit
MDVSVGPGRGSAAGSVVAYCLWITNIDPLLYNLLFERFLNPDRVSMPDIDIDFDDEGRGRVMDYVIKKYGANQVAQIITYGTMAAKSAIDQNEKNCQRMLEIFAERAISGKYFKERKYSIRRTMTFIDQKIRQSGDWYLSAEEAVYYGFADGILGQKGFESISKIRSVRKSK